MSKHETKAHKQIQFFLQKLGKKMLLSRAFCDLEDEDILYLSTLDQIFLCTKAFQKHC